MKQLIQPNLTVGVPAYYCLSYANKVFGIQDGAYYCAWDAWSATKFKHTDNLPTDVAVPVWFEWYGTVDGEYRNWGHAAVNVPGRGVYTSPLSGNGHAVYGSVSELARIWGLIYAGWSEDISGIQVVNNQGEDMAEILNLDSRRIIAHGILGRNGKAGRLNALDGSSDGIWNGQALTNKFIQDVFLSTESRQWRDSSDANSFNEMQRRYNALPIAEKTITDLQTALKNEQSKPPKEVVKEVTKIVTEYVDKPVEVIKEVDAPTTWAKVINFIRDQINQFLKRS